MKVTTKSKEETERLIEAFAGYAKMEGNRVRLNPKGNYQLIGVQQRTLQLNQFLPQWDYIYHDKHWNITVTAPLKNLWIQFCNEIESIDDFQLRVAYATIEGEQDEQPD